MLGLTRRRALFGVAATVAAAGAAARAEPPAFGTLTMHADVASDVVPARTIWVWAPPHAGRQGRLPVIYMHDGQNLFDSDLSGFGEWGVDEALTALSESTGYPGAIVVGIANSDQRRREYLPETFMAQIESTVRSQIEESVGGGALSEAYIAFLAATVKPLIEANYPVRRSREHVFTMGSSMGGLISLEMATRRPDVFGGAACLSTHWPLRFAPFTSADEVVEWQEALLPAVGRWVAAAPAPGRSRLWFDHGDLNFDRWYRPYQLAADAAFLNRGFRPGVDFISRPYPGTDHNEASWRARLQDPLRFLLGVRE